MVPLWHYKVLVSLLYNRFAWVTRHPGGSMTVPTSKFAAAIGLRGDKLKAKFDALHEAGLVDLYQWHGDYVVVRPAPPPGFGRTVGATSEVLDV
jgi:hypothetical protein